MSLLFHLHTKYSYDCAVKPRKIVEFALDKQIKHVAITDHDTIKGSVEASNFAKRNNLDVNVIIGAEYYTDAGDIIGLFLKEEIISRNAHELMDEVHKQGGIVVIPHPTRGHVLTDNILKKADIIEVFNARSNEKLNKEAFDLAVKFNKPIIVGNDAHVKTELPLCLNQLNGRNIRDAILEINEYKVGFSKKSHIIYSQTIKALKLKDFLLLVKQLKSMVSYFFVQPLRKIANRFLRK